jgi:tetratricopeptide (TPR) repeat protein
MKLAYAVGVVLLGLGQTGCAGHADKTMAARSALDHGDPNGALKALNEVLEVKSEKDLPEQVAGDNALFLLDRAMVLQELDHYPLSSRDLEVSDKQIEVLDLSANAAADIGRYIFSDDTGPYKAPAYEKLMINTMNMMNYLARSDLNGARVEARRLAVMQKFTHDKGDAAQSLLGPGSYLAGFVFEKSGKPEDALRYYDEALAYGQYQSLAEPIRRLSQQAGYSSPRFRELLSKVPAPEPSTDAPSDDDAELLVIVNFGRVPAKIAKRVPIGLALTYASAFMSPASAAHANQLALQGLVTWVNYPELGEPRSSYGRPTFMLDGQWARLEGMLAVDQEARRAWERARGAIVASAITRMITRVVAGQATKAAAGGDTLGTLLSLGIQATLTATDTPDTRNWSTLPARIAFGRVRIKAGSHTVALTAPGGNKKQTVTVPAGGWAVVCLTALN